MGLTIHYSLRSDASGADDVRRLVQRLQQVAMDSAMSEVGKVMEFSGDACDFKRAQDGSIRWLLGQARRMAAIGKMYQFVEPLQVIAFSTWPGMGCEAANFGLARYPDSVESQDGVVATNLNGWSWQSFCKTQYASDPGAGGAANFVRCHLTVIRLLEHAKAMGILDSVTDDSDFWENRDIEALVRSVGKWNRQVAAIVGQFKDQMDAVIAPIAEYPNFEHLEFQGRKDDRHDPHP
jgi:hypothetical protein